MDKDELRRRAAEGMGAKFIKGFGDSYGPKIPSHWAFPRPAWAGEGEPIMMSENLDGWEPDRRWDQAMMLWEYAASQGYDFWQKFMAALFIEHRPMRVELFGLRPLRITEAFVKASASDNSEPEAVSDDH